VSSLVAFDVTVRCRNNFVICGKVFYLFLRYLFLLLRVLRVFFWYEGRAFFIYDNTIFSFVLFNCKAGSGSNMIDLYQDHCPNDLSKFYGVERVDDVGFNIYVFRVQDKTTIKFDCDVRIYGQDEVLPAGCTASVRRRRSTETAKNVKGAGLEII